MTWWHRLFRRRGNEERLDQELRFHLDMHMSDLIARGYSPEEARRRARLALGGPEQVKEMCREIRRTGWLSDLWQDLHYGARMLMKKPGFTLIAVMTLALGIGANTAIFSMADKLLLRQLPVKDPDQLVLIASESVNPKFRNTVFSYPNYLDYRDQNEVFSDLLAFAQLDVKFGVGEQSEKISIELVSGNYFDALGVAAAPGRVIREEDNRTEDSHPIAVISHGCWQRRFGGQADVVGQTLQLNGAGYTIIGVAPSGFTGIRLETPAEAWVPLMMRRQLLSGTTSIFERKLASLRLIGRLKPGVTTTSAEAGFDLTARRIWETNTSLSDRNLPFNEKRILLEAGGRGMSSLRHSLGETLKLLLAVVALLLALACANLTNLLMARAGERRKEIAVRLALGAGRWRIIRQLLTESLLLACLGAGTGAILAPWLYKLLLAFQPGLVIERSTLQGSLDARVLGFTALTAVLSGLLFGLVPALQSGRGDLIPALKDADSGNARGERRWSVRNTLVVAQVALALVMLIGAGLLVRSLQRLFAVDLGFRAENLLIVPLDLPRAGYAAARDEAGMRAVDESNNQYFAQLSERVQVLPGVESATTAWLTPFSNAIAKNGVVIEGWRPKPGEENIAIDSNNVGPGYHELLGIPFTLGRGFTTYDHANASRVVVINEAMARSYFQNQNPLGKRFSLGPGRPWLEIIGVTRDYRLHNLTESATPHFDRPALQHPFGASARLVVRTKLDPLAVLPAVRKEALALNPQVTINAPTTLHDELRDSIAASRMASTLTSLFGLTALLLAAIGLYGVMSQTVSRRTHEIGLRMALGAGRRDVLRLVLEQGLVLTGLGLGLGLLAALMLTRLIRSLLYGVGTTDPLTFVAVMLLLAVVALLACWIPARRATKVDPMVALRCE